MLYRCFLSSLSIVMCIFFPLCRSILPNIFAIWKYCFPYLMGYLFCLKIYFSAICQKLIWTIKLLIRQGLPVWYFGEVVRTPVCVVYLKSSNKKKTLFPDDYFLNATLLFKIDLVPNCVTAITVLKILFKKKLLHLWMECEK